MEGTGTEAASSETHDEFEALQQVIAAMRPLSSEARQRIFDSAAMFLGVNVPAEARQGFTNRPYATVPTSVRAPSFSEDTSLSPKDFLLEKQPRTDVERVACLAYYLGNYRNTAHFKTLDLSKLNTEGAQPKFANAANSTNNAVKMGYLVPSTKGQRQLSAFGERFVRALPDREAARAVLETFRRRPRAKKSKSDAATEEA